MMDFFGGAQGLRADTDAGVCVGCKNTSRPSPPPQRRRGFHLGLELMHIGQSPGFDLGGGVFLQGCVVGGGLGGLCYSCFSKHVPVACTYACSSWTSLPCDTSFHPQTDDRVLLAGAIKMQEMGGTQEIGKRKLCPSFSPLG